MVRLRLILILMFFQVLVHSQGLQLGSIEGRVYNAKNNDPIPFANIVIWTTGAGTTSDQEGKFLLKDLAPGYVELKVSSVGFETYTTEQLLVTNANRKFVEIPMEETKVAIDAVVVKASPFRTTEESPVSLRRIGIEEIERNPGGNRDISKVIQSFPGVSSTPSFRNDVIVRGGGPSENRFYLDGVEIPNLNHFATQGASGGPVGIINVDFVREVNFYSGAFPADRGNALSSVLEFSQVDGNQEKIKFRGAIGASDLALTLDGPIASKTTFIGSFRRSYLQFLFSALQLPFLPTYNDAQFKVKSKLNSKTELILLGLVAIDKSSLNLSANQTESQRYILGYLPVNDQWNYTLGGVLKHFRDHSYDTWVLSHNFLNNRSYKYQDNIEVDSLKNLDYTSTEGEVKFRYENTARFTNDLKTNLGINLERSQYTNKTFQKIYAFNKPVTLQYSTNLNIIEWGIFGQASKEFFRGKLVLSAGVRADANSYSREMSNLLNQISPRFSASWHLNPEFNLNFNAGRYFEQPPYTTMGFRDLSGTLINQANGLRYISADHLVTGIDFVPDNESKLSLEGFLKLYHRYPVSLNDSIALASKGADFGTFGDEAVVSLAEGRAYGMEILYRNKNLFGANLICSYTLVRSEFQDLKQNWIVSSWDNRHIINITLTRDFKKGWNFGMKWRFVGGAPYTPWDLNKSSLQSAWDATGRPYPDYSHFNQLRLNSFHQLDVRIDKEFYFRKWSLITYLDIQNLYNYKVEGAPELIRQVDANGVYLPATGIPPRYPLKTIPSVASGTILPTVGIIVQF